jgi:hypothetical protein
MGHPILKRLHFEAVLKLSYFKVVSRLTLDKCVVF